MNKLVISLSFALAAFGANVHAAGDAGAGKAKSAACAACHGTDGNSAAPTFPKLAGQGADYLAKQLANFKSGERKNAIMQGQAAGLSEQDMADLGAYYAAQAPKLGKTNPESLEVGEKLYRGGNAKTGVPACMSCHGPTGVGNAPAKFPALRGQFAAYTESALKAFRSGERANDAGQMMRNIASKMSDGEIKAVSEYVVGLR
ncbi:MAG: cytochrome c4 [Chromatiales bacterium]|nr:cytochrome c4 [Chromatiales bacterium]